MIGILPGADLSIFVVHSSEREQGPIRYSQSPDFPAKNRKLREKIVPQPRSKTGKAFNIKSLCLRWRPKTGAGRGISDGLLTKPGVRGEPMATALPGAPRPPSGGAMDPDFHRADERIGGGGIPFICSDGRDPIFGTHFRPSPRVAGRPDRRRPTKSINAIFINL